MMSVTLEQIYEEVKTVREIVTGNGTPENGMVVKQARMEERQDALKEDIGDIKDSLKSHAKYLETFRKEFHEHAKSQSNRKSNPNGRILGIVPARAFETVWMWVVRGVIVAVLTLFTWICGNSEDLNWILDKGKQMKVEESTK
jgi:hypothetical protein